jgi:hypothetical protein
MRHVLALAAIALAVGAAGAGAALAGTPLAGTYASKLTFGPPYGGIWTITFTEAGDYTVRHKGAVQGTGSATVKGNTIVFHDRSGPTKCTGAQARNLYRYRLTGTTLTFTAVHDTCGRKKVLTQHPWRKTG